MAHHENLKILALISTDENALHQALSYFNEKGYPKVVAGDIESQIEHLAGAGQHRIVTDALTDRDSYESVQRAFPANIRLIAITHKGRSHDSPEAHSDFIEQADHYIGLNDTETLHHQLDTLIEKLDFTL